MVTRPLIDSIASITRPSWRRGVGSIHWLKQAKRTILSGMGGCSLCRVGLGNPSSTLGSVALPHCGILYRGPTSSPDWRRYCFDVGFFDLIIADESHRSIYNRYRDPIH